MVSGVVGPVIGGLEQTDGDNRFDIRALLAVLRRRWQILAACIGAITVIAGLLVYQVTPLYSVSSSLAINTQKTQIVNVQQVVGDVPPDLAVMETQATILRSPTLTGKLVDKLKLEADPEFSAPARAALEASKPAFDIFQPSSWFSSPNGQVSLIVPLRRLSPDAAARERSALIKSVTEAIKVRIQPRSYVLSITVTSQNPAKAARIANALAEVFISDQIETKYDATRRASSWLDGPTPITKSAVPSRWCLRKSQATQPSAIGMI